MKKRSILHFLLTTALSIQFLMMPVAPVYAKKKKEVVKYEEKDAHKNENFIWSGMLMLTMPVIAVMSIKSIQAGGTCYSPWIFSGSAVYYGVKEAMNWSEFKGGSEEALAIIRGEDKDLQLQTLQKAKEETARAREAVENKVQNARVASIGFGVAAAVALAEGIAESTGAAWAAGCKSLGDGAEDTSMDTPAESSLDRLFSPQPFYMPAPLQSPQEDSVSTLLTFLEKNNLHHSLSLDEYDEVVKSPIPALLPSPQLLTQVLNNTVNLLFPPANAAMTSFEQYGIIGGAALAALLYMKDFEWMKNHRSLFNGYARAAWYGGAAGIGMMAANEFEKVLEDLKDREKKYESLIHLLANTNKVNSMELNGSIKYSNQSTAPVLADPLKNNNNSPDDLCMTGGAGKAKPISCKRCNAVNKCKKSEIPQSTKFPADFPKDLAKATNLLKNMQDNRYKGNTSAATLAENKLGQYAAKVQKINKQLQDLANSNRVAKGQTPINFKDLSNKLMKKYKKSALSAINNLPSNYKTAFQELGGAGVPKPKATDIVKNNHTKRPLSKSGGITKKKATDKKDALADLDFGLDEEATGNTTQNSALAESEEYDYGEQKNDIHEGKDANIFKIITVRYLKSAYPRLLDEE